MPKRDSTDYVVGQMTAEMSSLRQRLDSAERRIDRVTDDLELLKRICYALMGAVTLVNLAGPVMQALGGHP